MVFGISHFLEVDLIKVPSNTTSIVGLTYASIQSFC